MTSTPPPFATADLCDEHGDTVEVLEGAFTSYGAHRHVAGSVTTLAVFEDNSLVRDAVAEPGEGRVLVIDGGGSLRRSLVGDRLAATAAERGWAGLVVDGAVRDSAVLATVELAILARGTCPRRTVKRGEGRRDVPVRIGGVTITPGMWLAADPDGVIVAPRPLL
ncbi:MAG: RraA family protein [Actinomyces sp.]|nr:MAG: RraA family protein [Actinomyces sp.]